MHSSRGIVLQALPYQDHHHITTLLTDDLGVIRLFVRGSHRMRQHSLACVTPLTLGEWIFTKPRSGTLYRFRDASIQNQHLELRSDFDTLQTGCFLAESVASSQMNDRPAPALFALLLAYLQQLPGCTAFRAIRASFLLKILRHEGVFALSTHCIGCSKPAGKTAGAASYCESCAPSWATSIEDLALCEQLAFARRLDTLEEISETLFEQIEELCRCERGDLNPHRISPTTTSR